MTQPSRRRSRVAKKSPLPLIILGVAALVVVGVAAFLLLGNNRGISSSTGAEVQVLEDEGRDHVAQGANVDYQSNPPTSGNHWSSTAPWGAYRETAPADENLVHNLEHGGVIIWYDPARLSQEQQDQLFEIYRSLILIERRVVFTVRSDMPTPIALTAWNHLLALDTVDEAAIRDFFDTYILEGPECVERRCPG